MPLRAHPPALIGVSVFFGVLTIGSVGASGFIPETRVVLRSGEEKVVLVARGRTRARILKDIAGNLSGRVGRTAGRRYEPRRRAISPR